MALEERVQFPSVNPNFVEDAEDWAERYVRGFDSYRLASTLASVVDWFSTLP